MMSFSLNLIFLIIDLDSLVYYKKYKTILDGLVNQNDLSTNNNSKEL